MHASVSSPCAPWFVHLAFMCVAERPEPLEGQGGRATSRLTAQAVSAIIIVIDCIMLARLPAQWPVQLPSRLHARPAGLVDNTLRLPRPPAHDKGRTPHSSACPGVAPSPDRDTAVSVQLRHNRLATSLPWYNRLETSGSFSQQLE